MADYRRTILQTLVIAVYTLTASLSQNVPPIQPVSYNLPVPPVLMGPMAANNVLTDGERVHPNQTKGVTSMVSTPDNLFASTVDSKIYDMARCPPRLIANLAAPGCVGKYQCGQLTSLRLYPANGHLLALDTFRGLFMVHPVTGSYRLLFSTNTPVNGRRPVHLNDMVVTSSGVVILSDSSDVYSIDYDTYICMDGRNTGRLMIFDPRTLRMSELQKGQFNFPNGLELTPEGDLLVAETCRAAIHRVSLQRNSWLRVEPFSLNLPGLPDNIRSSGRGTYWVAMSYARHSGISNPLDQNSRIPNHRAMGFRYVSLKELRNLFTKWGIVVELDKAGAIVGSLHDPTGNTLSMITEVNEFGGVLNIGSHIANYMIRFVLPAETGIKTSVDSFLQIKRSRCELPDSKVAEVRRQLLQKEQANTTLH
ncbi:unnamed protein product [Candidula unifasciata]|uniref:Strictosidine synthase conserved region domain-containing protein n=1 Tax=Candidula unifasciata TaxID=100452 RepID=A0A8S3ZCY1_9EUPU|nr:unnamed protein product [Candidula unifasciata]